MGAAPFPATLSITWIGSVPVDMILLTDNFELMYFMFHSVVVQESEAGLGPNCPLSLRSLSAQPSHTQVLPH